jgi:dTMP kinase
MNKGRLIVIDGIDGSGKTTQVRLLKDALICETISFPRYEDNEYGRLVKNYLEGEFGLIDEVDPHKMAYLFAGDRLLAKSQIEKWLAAGKMVIANRYISASKAHLGANLPDRERTEFFKWIEKLEYGTNKMPKEDLTIILEVDPKIGQKNVSGHGSDIHEENLEHLAKASKIYLELAKKEKNWYVIGCIKDGEMRAKEDIHQDIMQILK